MRALKSLRTALLVTTVTSTIASAQDVSTPAGGAMAHPDSLSIDRLFRRGEFRSAALPNVTWLANGAAYLDVAANASGGTDIVRVDLPTGARTVVVPASAMVDEKGARFEPDEIALSPDESKLLVFHDVVSVFRHSRRGTNHVVDLATRKVLPVSRAPGLQLLARFAPDSRRVSFVRDNDLWVSDPATGREDRLTTDGSETIINGTTDWVYEEEWGFYDAYRWSPDGTRIAFWRFDQAAVPRFPLVNERPLYPQIVSLHYPKAGQPNARVRIGVIRLAAPTSVTWMQVGADTGLYFPRMEWAGNDSLLIHRVPRRQSQVDLLMVNATTGAARVMFTDRDSAYVDIEHGFFQWVAHGKQFVWRSDRSGWAQVFLVNRNGTIARQVTTDGADVLDVLGVDDRAGAGAIWVKVAAPDPTQGQVYRYPLFKAGPAVRLSREKGTHNWSLGPGARWAIDIHTAAGVPPRALAIQLATGSQSVLEGNAALAAKLGALAARPPEFFRLPLPDGTMLDAYRIVPANFDSTRAHPVLMYTYGGPAAPSVVDAWGGTRYLWHLMLAQRGYVVVAVDNRGAAWRGRDFRKVTQLRLGVLEARDQVAAAKWIGTQRWADASRIGIWGWSFGGYLTTMSTAMGGSVFKAGIAVAPVTDWRYYDTIYTERFMLTPEQNEPGYQESSPIAHLEGLKAMLLVVHGTGDDNVHPQNTLNLADRLVSLGRPFEMMLYPNRTHSISEGAGTTAHLYETMTRFILGNL